MKILIGSTCQINHWHVHSSAHADIWRVFPMNMCGAWWKAKAAVDQTTVFYLVNINQTAVFSVDIDQTTVYYMVDVDQTAVFLVNIGRHRPDCTFKQVDVDQMLLFDWSTSTDCTFWLVDIDWLRFSSNWSMVDAFKSGRHCWCFWRQFLLRFSSRPMCDYTLSLKNIKR